MILVTGASGTNGREVLKVLASRGVKARALVRNPAKAGDLGSGVELVQGDLSDPASLSKAMSGATGLFALAPVHRDALAWFDNLFTAAKHAGVQHVVKFSGLGADHPQGEIMRQHGESDKQLMASGLSWTILRPNSFYQNLLGSAGTIKAIGQFFLPMADAKQSCEDVRDIAEVAAVALTNPAAHAGKIYDITGPEALTYTQAAEIMSKTLGKAIEYVPVPTQAAVKAMMDAGLPEWNAKAVGELMEAFVTTGYSQITDSIQKVTGKPARTFESFIRDNAAAFS